MESHQVVISVLHVQKKILTFVPGHLRQPGTKRGDASHTHAHVISQFPVRNFALERENKRDVGLNEVR